MPAEAVTVLVVDDNPAHRYAKVRLLSQAGYTVRQASSGSEALEMAAEVDVLLLDVFLPDLDGYSVCRRLRANEKTANLPILHMSGVYSGDVAMQESQRVGADAFLTKPVPAEVLTDSIEAAIRKRAG